jgi:hypothetical protein
MIEAPGQDNFEAENASQIVKLRQRLCEEFGLSGRRIAADRLHISVHGIGAYDGLPRAVVRRAKEAGAAVLAKPFAGSCDELWTQARSRATVRDFVPIQSLRGRGKHIHLARWSLRG